MGAMKITMVLQAHNAQDIISENLIFHHSKGVSNFIVVDDIGISATSDILNALSKEMAIDILFLPQRRKNQKQWVSNMAEKAFTEHEADWIIFGTTDEFWSPHDGDLKDFLSKLSTETNALLVQRYIAVVTCEKGNPLMGAAHPKSSRVFECENFVSPIVLLSKKNFNKYSRGPALDRSGIKLRQFAESFEVEKLIRILKYPDRSLEQYSRKVQATLPTCNRNSMALKARDTAQEEYDSDYNTDEIKRYWVDLVHTKEEIEIGILSGRLIRDNTVVGVFDAREQQAQQNRLRNSAERLMAQSKALVEESMKRQAEIIASIPRRERRNYPLYYNLKFSSSGPEAQLRSLQKLVEKSTPEKVCGNFSELRDAFSLFPRNEHIKDFLRDVLILRFQDSSTHLREDCKKKRIVLHTSCQQRLAASEEAVDSFDPLQGNYHHIILLGQNITLDEGDIDLSFSYDGRYLTVPTPDNYESLHRKLFYAYTILDILADPRLLVKIDDNILLKDAVQFDACINAMANRDVAYAGRKVGAERHANQWHGWHISKCADPVIETRGYQYPLPREYAAGGYGYVLGPMGLSACSYMYLAMKAFFSLQSVGLEDAYVGHAAFAHGLELFDLSSKDTLLTLPGLITREKRDLLTNHWIV